MSNRGQVRAEEKELRRQVYQSQHEPGLQALLRLAELDRNRALKEWRAARDVDLVKYQTMYNNAQNVIDYITVQPREFDKPE